MTFDVFRMTYYTYLRRSQSKSCVGMIHHDRYNVGCCVYVNPFVLTGWATAIARGPYVYDTCSTRSQSTPPTKLLVLRPLITRVEVPTLVGVVMCSYYPLFHLLASLDTQLFIFHCTLLCGKGELKETTARTTFGHHVCHSRHGWI